MRRILPSVLEWGLSFFIPKWRARNPLQGSFQEIRNVASIVNRESRRLYELLKEADAEKRSGFVATERSSRPIKS
jgi:hypothetical protein